jgi:tRNA pseudouridine38-40 synthase
MNPSLFQNQPEKVILINFELLEKRQYRISVEKLGMLREIVKQFQGTKNHHNFTVGKSFKEASAKRFIMSFSVSDPFVRSGMEWVSLKIHGQSFMLHQIRKMIGLAVMVIRTKTPVELISRCFDQERINIPKAPALGLLLERPVFAKYNEFTGSLREDRGEIDFDVYKVYCY